MRVGFAVSARVWQGLSGGARAVMGTQQTCAVRPVMTAAAGVGDRTLAAIKENNVMVFSKSRCPYCFEVKSLLGELGVEHAVWELDEVRSLTCAMRGGRRLTRTQRPDGREIQDFLYEETGQTTVPNVFIGEQHVGGCDGMFWRDSRARWQCRR